MYCALENGRIGTEIETLILNSLVGVRIGWALLHDLPVDVVFYIFLLECPYILG